LYVLKLNFSKEIPGDTEICHSISAAACVRRTLYTKIVVRTVVHVLFVESALAAMAAGVVVNTEADFPLPISQLQPLCFLVL
jgi:hypothetical protein